MKHSQSWCLNGLYRFSRSLTAVVWCQSSNLCPEVYSLTWFRCQSKAAHQFEKSTETFWRTGLDFFTLNCKNHCSHINKGLNIIIPIDFFCVFYQRKCPQSPSLLNFVLYLYSKFHLEKFNAKVVRSAFLENDYLGHCLWTWSKHTLRMRLYGALLVAKIVSLFLESKGLRRLEDADHGVAKTPLCFAICSASEKSSTISNGVKDSKELGVWGQPDFYLTLAKPKKSLLSPSNFKWKIQILRIIIQTLDTFKARRVFNHSMTKETKIQKT